MSRSDSQAGKTTTTWILILSVVANVALAGAALRLRAKPATPPLAATNRVTLVAIETQLVAAAGAPASLIWVTNRFHWRQVESTNYEAFVANLRAIGCPEKTVCDIVLADVGRHYETLRRDTATNLPFWTGGKQRKAAASAQAARMDALDQEQSRMLERLLGGEPCFNREDSEIARFDEQALARFLMGPMEEDTFLRAVRLPKKYEALKNALTERTGGILTDEDEAELRHLNSNLKQEFQVLLTPAQWDEMNARMSGMELFKDDFSEAVDLTPAEARQIALLWSASGDAFGFFGMSRNETDEEEELRNRQFTNSVARMLGEKRFTEFERAQDYEFRQLSDLARENNLPKEAAVKVYDIRQLAAEEVERLRKDTSLDESARQKKFDQMQDELQKAVSGALGAPAYQDYLRRAGMWITNVTRL